MTPPDAEFLRNSTSKSQPAQPSSLVATSETLFTVFLCAYLLKESTKELSQCKKRASVGEGLAPPFGRFFALFLKKSKELHLMQSLFVFIDSCCRCGRLLFESIKGCLTKQPFVQFYRYFRSPIWLFLFIFLCNFYVK